ncbi:MAG: hypothetical protein WBE99_06270 [Xanthobacteraceae bacterium]
MPHDVAVLLHDGQQQLLALGKPRRRRFGALARADIGDGAEHHQPVFGVDRIEPDLDRNLGSIFTHAVKVAADAHAACFRLRDEVCAMAAMGRAPGLRHQNIDGPVEQFLAPVAEQPLGLGVDQHDLAAASVMIMPLGDASTARRTISSEAKRSGMCVSRHSRIALSFWLLLFKSCNRGGRRNQVIKIVLRNR